MGWLSVLLHPRHRGEDPRNLQSLSPQEEESEMNGKTRKECYVNRELSWLKFNQRVLEEAERETVPLCERLSFAAIYQSNLDEFFMVRIGSLKDQIPMGEKARDSKTGLLPRQQIEAVLEAVKVLTLRRDALYRSLMEQLARAGVRIVDFHTISQADSKRLEAYFVRELLPLLSPVVVGKRQPFPFLRNKEIYAVAVLDRKNGKRRLGLIPCATGVFPRLVTIAPGEYILSEELILHFLPLTFKGYQIHAKSLVRVTRSADIDADAVYDEDLDYREFMAELVRKRKKLEPVRLELSRPLSQETLEELCKTIGLDKKGVLESRTPLDLSFFSQIQDQLRQNLDYFYPRFTPQKSAQFVSGQPFLPQVLQKDKLLAYPFQRMDPFLQILREAASDETVVMLSHKKPDSVINVKVEFGEGEGKVPLDNIAKRAEAYKPKERVTYKMIKEYIEAKYGFKVHTAYIAEVKRDLGLPMYDAPNAVEELKQPRKHPTPEKVEAIKDALKHFEVI